MQTEEVIPPAFVQAGMKIRRHYVDPAQGWMITSRWGLSAGPFATFAEAVDVGWDELNHHLYIEPQQQADRRWLERIGGFVELLVGLMG